MSLHRSLIRWAKHTLSLVLVAILMASTATAAQAAIAAANTRNTSMGTELRTLRIAVSAAAGYSAQFVGNATTDLEKKQNVYDAIAAGIDRINEVYEVEIGVHLALIPFNANIIFLDSASQPFSETNHSTDGAANQTLLTNVIGSANYDIGHVVSKKGGGQGTMNALTYPSSKGKGSSGGSNATGDKFWIELVAHEIGHQLAANHSFDGNVSMCGGEVEPGYNTEVGSGSSIMSYAATCGADDLQAYSDAYFTPFSYEEIRRELEGAPSVGTRTATNNSVPQISAATASTLIPPQTPFTLTASGSDSDVSNTLTYSWDQIDTTSTSAGKALTDEPKLSGALFRPLTPSATGNVRTFPQMSNIFAGRSNQNTGSCTGVSAIAAELLACRVEFLPTTARTLHFRATVRDGVGGRNGADTTVSVIGSTPFSVTSHNSASVWRSGSSQTITWDTAGTESWTTPFSQVDIDYTTDMGESWVSLASAVANDGSQDVTAPNLAATNFRIRVKPVGAVFFDINDAALTVSESSTDLPTPPTGLAVTYKADTSGALTFTWSAPLDGGTSTVTRYVVQAVQDSAKTCSVTSIAPATPALTCSITGLTVGTSYTFRATAQNTSGTSELSSETSAITAAGIPSAQTITDVQQTATGGIKVFFTLGAANSSAITGIKIGHWTATSSNYLSRSTLTNSGQTSFVYTTSLTLGTQYKFKVWGVNGVGLGTPSSFSNLITAASTPGAPTSVSATVGDTRSTVSWTAAASNGSSITSYLVTSSPGGLTCTTVATSCEVSGLSNGTAYTFSVVAANVLGNSAASTASAAITPQVSSSVPVQTPVIGSQPSGDSVTVGQSASFSVAASVTDSGTLSYQWYKDGTAITGATADSFSISTVALGDAGAYSVTVTNTLGQDTAVATSVAATLSVAAAPTVSTPSSGLSATANSAFSLTVSATGTGLVYAVASGSLPAGLSLNSGTGVISGTPTAAGEFSVVVSVTDSNSASVSTNSFTLTVAKANQSTLTVASTSGTSSVGLTLATSGGSTSGSVSFVIVRGTASSCSLVSGVLTASGVGTCLVTATMAGNDLFNSVSSAQTTVTFAATSLSTPGQPTLAAVSGSTTALTVTFTAVSDASSYTVRVYASSDSTLVTTMDGFVSGDSVTGLTAATGYTATVTAVGDGVNYSNSSASTQSTAVFTLAAAATPTISTAPPAVVDTAVGQAVTLRVTATTGDAGQLSYQWKKNGTMISGATSTTYRITATSTALSGSYTVVVTNSLNGTTAVTTSTASNVTVIALPSSLVRSPTTVSSTVIKQLTTRQVAVIPTTLLRQIPVSAVKALTRTQVAAITTAQVTAFTSTQIKAMTTSQISALRPTTLGSMTLSQIRALTTSQAKALTSSQRAALSNEALALVNAKRRAVLPFRIIP